jgi:alpha,alpha-trehalose phosphorylase
MPVCHDCFSPEQRARNFEYYERITVRDSSLSACTEAVAAADAGHLRLAFDYAAEAALLDLEDFEHNTRDGLHLAALAGVWIAFVFGSGGMNDSGNILAFVPRLPDGLTRLKFSILHRGQRLSAEVTTSTTKYALSQGEGPVPILHHGERLTLTGSEPISRPIPEAPDRSEPTQPPGRAPRRRLAA